MPRKIKKNKGRPSVDENALKRAIERAFTMCTTLKEVCEMVGTSSTIINKIKKNDPAFAEAIAAFKKKRTERPVVGVEFSRKPLPSIEQLKHYYRDLLSAQGKDAYAIDAQLEVVAWRYIDVCLWRRERDNAGYMPVVDESSREGDSRFKVNPIEKLYDKALEAYQRSLQAAGLNCDCKTFGMQAAAIDDDDYDNWQPSNKRRATRVES